MKTFFTFILTLGGLACLLFLANCKRDASGPASVQGRILDSCVNGKPIPNVTVRLQDNHKPGLLGGGCKDHIDLTAKTDSNGQFYFQYDKVCFSDPLTLSASKGAVFIEVSGIDVKTGANLGDIVMKNNFTYAIFLYPDSAYSTADTLFYDIKPKPNSFPFDTTYKIKTGPFAAGFIDTLVTSIHYDVSLNARYGVPQRWILKSGQTVHVKGDSLYRVGFPCSSNNRVNIHLHR